LPDGQPDTWQAALADQQGHLDRLGALMATDVRDLKIIHGTVLALK